MGMPITVEIVDEAANEDNINKVFDYFRHVDEKFSTYKKESEISLINRGLTKKNRLSSEMKQVLLLCSQTKELTNGYFDIDRDGYIDPSGLVKGWSIFNAANLIKKMGFANYYIEAGGDIQIEGTNPQGDSWTVGIRNPFNVKEIVKIVKLEKGGIATSGTYFRGQHVYNPFSKGEKIEDIVSISVIGPDVYEADRFATAAFAMGVNGINFIEGLSGFEGYMIDQKGIATMTTGFEKYTT